MTRKFPTPLGKSTLQNWGNSTCKKQFTTNYIHKFLEGRTIPVPGSRYFENVGHSVKDTVMLYLSQMGKREIFKGSNRPMEYYVKAHPVIEGLGPNILLSNGATHMTNNPFHHLDFLWEERSYGYMNAFCVDYGKSILMKLADARLKETGELDFFRALQNSMVLLNPQTAAEFFKLIDGLVVSVDGVKAGEWLKQRAGFAGKVETGTAYGLMPVRGDFRNIKGANNPNRVYALAVSRTPGTVREVQVEMALYNEQGQKVIEDSFVTGFHHTGEPNGLPVPKDLKPGAYTARMSVNGVEVARTTFNVVGTGYEDYVIKPPSPTDARPAANITVAYESSIPKGVQDYLDELRLLIEPIIRAFVGEPIANQHLVIKHDPEGLAGMNGNMTVLNFKILPDITRGVDTNADSFFYIEYYHMFHRGSDIPVKEARYNENISQAMKIVVAHYLGQQELRKIGGGMQPIPQQIAQGRALATLGGGILHNHGINNGNPGASPLPERYYWQHDSIGQQFMNVLTLNYSLSVWLQLADARYRASGEYDFFLKLQDAIYARRAGTPELFYQVIDQLVGARIDGKQASEWLRKTPAFSPLSSDAIYVRPLPANGNGYFIAGMDNPRWIFPYVVERNAAAKLLETECALSIKDSSGQVVWQKTISTRVTENGPFGEPVPDTLKNGVYTAVLEVSYKGQKVVGRQEFTVLRE